MNLHSKKFGILVVLIGLGASIFLCRDTNQSGSVDIFEDRRVEPTTKTSQSEGIVRLARSMASQPLKSVTLWVHPKERLQVESSISDSCESRYLSKFSPFGACVTAEVGELIERLRESSEMSRIIDIRAVSKRNFREAQYLGYGEDPHAPWADVRKGTSTILDHGKVGIIEFSFNRTDASHVAFDHAQVHDFDTSLPPSMSAHVTKVASVFTYQNLSGQREILPKVEVFAANINRNGSPDPDYFAALDWFVENNVRFINVSTYMGSCGQPRREHAAALDWFARQYDWVVTTATGQTEGNCDPEAPVHCQSLNAVCVGGYLDRDAGGDVGDDLTRGQYVNPGAGEWDREEPDVVGHWNFDTPIGSNGYEQSSGTSFSSPMALASYAESLAWMNSEDPDAWKSCRISELVRGLAKFHAGEHPVSESTGVACSNNSCPSGQSCVYGECAVLKRTAPHELATSNTVNGISPGGTCYTPDQCDTGLTCLFGRCEQNPGDERSGWGGTTLLNSMLDGEWICARGSGGEACMPTQDGSCGRPSSSEDDISPSEAGGPGFTPTPPPGKSTIHTSGAILWTGVMDEGDVFRGVLSWSACPNYFNRLSVPQTASCSSNSDCPSPYICDQINSYCLQQFNTAETAVPDFDVLVWKQGWDSDQFIWLSYSEHDVLEAFEFVAPESGTYWFWRFADRDNWDEGCDASLSDFYDPDYSTGEIWEFFYGEIL